MGSGIEKLVAQVDRGKYKTMRQVAAEVGRHPSRIRAAQREGLIPKPTHKMILGDGTKGSFVWLYTSSDITAYKKHFRSVRPGRPPRNKESAESSTKEEERRRAA